MRKETGDNCSSVVVMRLKMNFLGSDLQNLSRAFSGGNLRAILSLERPRIRTNSHPAQNLTHARSEPDFQVSSYSHQPMNMPPSNTQ